MKIAIMTDSNSGITAQEAQQLGVALLPMPHSDRRSDVPGGNRPVPF